VTWRWVYAFYVYPNTLVKLQLSGRQIVDVLEHSARYYRGMDCSPGGDCAVVTDTGIPHYNVDTIEGISYRIDPTRPEGQRVRDLRFEGRPVDLGRRFTIVCNNYRAAGGGGFPHLAEAEVIWQSSEEMADLIGDYLARAGTWYPKVNDNWRLGPAITSERPAAVHP
jgi:2',3'-cyclic-nucleotide 2'-phosphodiesterase/3'-nucleotidase